MRRALARARDGKSLDVAEAEVLLHARGEDLQILLEHAICHVLRHRRQLERW